MLPLWVLRHQEVRLVHPVLALQICMQLAHHWFFIRDDSHWASGAKVSVFTVFNWSRSGIYHWNAHLTMLNRQDSTSYIDSRPKTMVVHHVYSGSCLWGFPVRNRGARNHIDLLTWLESDRLLYHNSSSNQGISYYQRDWCAPIYGHSSIGEIPVTQLWVLNHHEPNISSGTSGDTNALFGRGLPPKAKGRVTSPITFKGVRVLSAQWMTDRARRVPPSVPDAASSSLRACRSVCLVHQVLSAA